MPSTRSARAGRIGLISVAAAGILGIGPSVQSVAVASGKPDANSPPTLAQAAPPLGAPAAKTPAVSPAGTGLVTIEADSQQADNATGIITAKGNVRITYPDRQMVATSRQAQYFSKEGRLVLSGDVDVIDERGQRLQAERVIYLLDSERLLAQPPAGRQVLSRFRLPAPASPAPGGSPAGSQRP